MCDDWEKDMIVEKDLDEAIDKVCKKHNIVIIKNLVWEYEKCL